MRRVSACLLLAASLPALAQQRRPLIVISLDGLDHRYLRDANKLGLRIPNIRRLMKFGEWADGVIGIAPTVTWPSHTTMITGVRADEHGILGNRRPKSEGGDYYWSSSLLKVKTLWHSAGAAGLKTAAITWPVTVDASITFNLPEFFRSRNGGGMDMASIEEKGTRGLIAKIASEYPSFPHQWMDDRARVLATIYLLKRERPGLILLHLVDHDAEAHDRGPFTREANAMIEYTDELIGRILEAAPKDQVVALVSDHGFERVDKMIPVASGTAVAAGLALARDANAIGKLRPLAGREVPMDEVSQYAPQLSEGHIAAFEPPEHAAFTQGAETAPRVRGEHGFWPTRTDYRSVFILWGPGVKARRTPPMSMLDIAPRLARILGVNLQ